MIAAIRDHQHKSYGIRDALRSEGWFVVPAASPADVLLIDYDGDAPMDHRALIDAYAARGTPIVIYPHGANPLFRWDGIVEPYPVDACMVIGTGQRDVMLTYGYPHPIEVIGWSFCEQRPFVAREPERVLFCPQHPLGNGYLVERLRDANKDAYNRILTWGLPITVRHVHSVEANGLWDAPNVTYEPAGLSLALGSIDEHDVVVARDTLLSTAVARGIPAIAFGQRQFYSDPSGPEEPDVEAASWEKYGEKMRYPYDIGDLGVLEQAVRSEATSWRERFVGAQMNARSLADLLASICRSPRSPSSPPRNGGSRAVEPASASS